MIKTITTWDYVQTDNDLIPFFAKIDEMIKRGVAVQPVKITSSSGIPVIKERVWATLEAAEEWKTFTLAQPVPPSSCVVFQE